MLHQVIYSETNGDVQLDKTIVELQKEVACLRSTEQVQRENDDLRKLMFKRLDGVRESHANEPLLDEERSKCNKILAELQKEVDRLRSTEQVQRENAQRENENFRAMILKRLDGLQDSIHTQRTELQEQRLLILRMTQYHQLGLTRIDDSPEEMEDAF